jgi:uncharacterized protein (TIGR02001 family)
MSKAVSFGAISILALLGSCASGGRILPGAEAPDVLRHDTALAIPVVAEEMEEAPKLEASVDATVANLYIWRGLVLTDDPVFQPSVDLNKWGFNLNIWGNMDLGDVNNADRRFTEIDFTLGYSHSFEQLTVGAALLHYMFPNTTFEDTTELVLSAELDVLLSPSLSIVFDLDESVGANYWNLAAGHSIPMSPFMEGGSWSIDFSGSIGYGNADYHQLYVSTNKDGLSDLMLGVSAPFDFGNGIVLTPFVNFTSIITDDLRDAIDAGTTDPDNLLVGVSATLNL